MSKKSVGGIWKKHGQYGEFFSISIEIDGKKMMFTGSANQYKADGDKKPDFVIFPYEPKASDNDQAQTPPPSNSEPRF